ncbi:hypothetical protein K6W26_32240, partial [Burkholderia sp. AU42008]|uniref:hypothetical protein n=1 Tax=Burkholderia sp. AU42008 TaxID=2871156 RepID=UPI001C9331F7
PTSGVCGGGADSFFPHAARKTAAVATVIKRYGTRSTRMERPLCITNGMSAAPERSATRMRLAALIEHLNYWTTGYSKSARDLHADGMPRTADKY